MSEELWISKIGKRAVQNTVMRETTIRVIRDDKSELNTIMKTQQLFKMWLIYHG